jgi:uncharacterized membrane protein
MLYLTSKKMAIEKSRWIPRIGVIVSVLALIFQLIAFATDGWHIEGHDWNIEGYHYKTTSRSLRIAEKMEIVKRNHTMTFLVIMKRN